MPLSESINSFGLVLDIIGVCLVWKFGLPAEISRAGAMNLIAEQSDDPQIEQGKMYDRWSKIGLSCLLMGFVFQLISNFIRLI
jgi:hypothetical protein